MINNYIGVYKCILLEYICNNGNKKNLKNVLVRSHMLMKIIYPMKMTSISYIIVIPRVS